MPDNDLNNCIGDRGEALFEKVMTSFHGGKPLFRRPRFLGEKWPMVDYVCELYGHGNNCCPFFFVQVKTTTAGCTPRSKRLRVKISKERAVGLSKYKAPVYLVGVDSTNERLYLVGATGHITGLSSLHTGFELDGKGRSMLAQEVRRYWRNAKRPSNWTTMKEPSWT